MLSYQDQYELWQSLASDSDSTNLSMGQKLINIGYHKVERALGIFTKEKEHTFTTVTDAISSDDQDYRLPRGFLSFTDLYVTVGTTQYYIKELIQNPEWWRRLNSTTTQTTSDFLQYAYIRGTKLFVWPIPSSANTAKLIYQGTSKDLSAADYTDGTITTLANGGTSITASGSTFTASMEGRFFQVTDDGEWHKIQSFDSTTTLTLETPYQGSAITAGTAAYKIGEMAELPEDIHDLPVTYALWKYFSQFRRDKVLASNYKSEWLEGLAQAKADYANADSSSIITQSPDGGVFGAAINPNFYPESIS